MMIGLPDDDVPAQDWRIVHTGSALIRQIALWELAHKARIVVNVLYVPVHSGPSISAV
jgi:hypothetical protein